jgi:ATPase subunit of ABC transporter with duplicated ATPase domains
MIQFICEFCNKQLSTKFNLNKHFESCKRKNIIEVQKQLDQQRKDYEKQLDQQRKDYEQRLDQQHKDYEKQLYQQCKDYEQQLQTQKEIHKLQLQKQQEQIEKMEKQIEKMETQIFEIAKQPKQVTNNNNNNTNTQTTNNRILNITNNLVPMDLTDEQIREILKNKYTREIFLGGPDSITEMTVSQLLTDQETGKFRIVCTDASRNVFYYQDCDENLVKDIGMEVVHKKIQKPLVEATSSHFTRIDNEKSMDDDELCILLTENMSFIDHELPNKLKRKLQLPVNAQE